MSVTCAGLLSNNPAAMIEMAVKLAVLYGIINDTVGLLVLTQCPPPAQGREGSCMLCSLVFHQSLTLQPPAADKLQ